MIKLVEPEISHNVMNILNNERDIFRLGTDLQNDLIDNLKETLQMADINFSGDLSDSIKSYNEGQLKFVMIDSPYASIVDKGLPPGTRVNFDALKNWVTKKLGITGETELMEATFKIQNKILGKGIQPTFFVKKAIKKLTSTAGVSLKRRIGQKRQSSRSNKTVRTINKYNRKLKKVAKIVNTGEKLLKGKV